MKIRHNEHITYARSNNPQLAYAIHILNNGHEGSPVDEIMELAKPFPEMVYDKCFRKFPYKITQTQK